MSSSRADAQEGLTDSGPRAFWSDKIAIIKGYFVLPGGGRGMEVPVLCPAKTGGTGERSPRNLAA